MEKAMMNKKVDPSDHGSQEDRDDGAWDALLADLEHQKTLSQVVENLKASYESGELGEPTIETGDKKED
jgi:hypothetical protein